MTKTSVCLAPLLAAACSSSSPAGAGSADGGDGSPPSSTSSTASASGNDASPGATSSNGGSSGGSDGGSDGAASGGAGSDAGTAPAADAGKDAGPAPGFTVAGVPLPAGFTRVLSDRFGTGPDATVTTLAALHARYYEAQYYDRTASGLVQIPNTVINQEQETYSHFEQVIVFSTDHLTIQARGHQDGSITSGEMVSVHTARTWCVEGKYQVPATDKAWAALWWYGAAAGGDASEIDIEQPNTPTQGVHDMSLHNHPYEYDSIRIVDPDFTTAYMTWTNPAFDASARPHAYTACYDDAAATLTRWVDGREVYAASWKWNKSLGGTGKGPDATTIVNLAVGGSWPGNTGTPTTYSADLDVYSLDYYGLSP